MCWISSKSPDTKALVIFLVGNSSHMLSYITTKRIKCDLKTALQEATWKLTSGFSWTPFDVTFDFAAFKLYPFIVINYNCEKKQAFLYYVSHSSESSKLSVDLGTPKTEYTYLKKKTKTGGNRSCWHHVPYVLGPLYLPESHLFPVHWQLSNLMPMCIWFWLCELLSGNWCSSVSGRSKEGIRERES